MENFIHLLTNPAHWAFELVIVLIVDGLIGAILWPRIKKFGKHHKEDDRKLDILWKERELVKSRWKVVKAYKKTKRK